MSSCTVVKHEKVGGNMMLNMDNVCSLSAAVSNGPKVMTLVIAINDYIEKGHTHMCKV